MDEPLHHPHAYQHVTPLNAHIFSPSSNPAALVDHHDLDSIDFSSFETALQDPDTLVPFEAPSQASFDPTAPVRFDDVRTPRPLGSFPSQPAAVATQFNLPSRVPTGRPQDDAAEDGGPFGVFQLQGSTSQQSQSQSTTLGPLRSDFELRPRSTADGSTTDDRISNLKLIPDPPSLQDWRQRLFDVEDTITMTEDEYALPMSYVYENWD